MKKTRIKVLAVVMALVMVAVSSSLLTVAYLKSESDGVVNTFSNSAKVKISLDEACVDAYGKQVEADSSESPNRTQANDYKLIPGHEYIKDPTIHVEAGSEQCYLFVKVVNPLTAIEADTTIATQMTNNGWAVLGAANDIYVYIGKGDTANTAGFVVDAREAAENIDIVIFNKLNIKSDADLTAVDNNAQITINAYAIQADGFTNASQAWIASGFAPTPAPASSTHPVASGS